MSVPESLADRFTLSNEEASALATFDRLLLETNARTNLVSRPSVEDRWDRHYADSLQLWSLLPHREADVLDIGSGGGFPAIPLAILARERAAGLRFTLCESVGKKASFLRDAVATLSLSHATVRGERAERLRERFDVVTARAVTALPGLVELAADRLRPDGTLIAPKGRSAEAELAKASEAWRMTVRRATSATDPTATIFLLTDLERRS